MALTRPQMFAGVTYSYFIANAVIATELFLIFKSIWALAVALIVHLVGVIMCLREPRVFDLWLTRVSRTPARQEPQDLAMQLLPPLTRDARAAAREKPAGAIICPMRGTSTITRSRPATAC